MEFFKLDVFAGSIPPISATARDSARPATFPKTPPIHPRFGATRILSRHEFTPRTIPASNPERTAPNKGSVLPNLA